MPFYKKVEIIDATEKYGFQHRAVVARERIKRGENVFSCDTKICVYKANDDRSLAKTGDEMREIMQKFPHTKNFMLAYCYMIDDDLYDYPYQFMDLKLSDELCMIINHSCEPNMGFSGIDCMVAIRDIEPGEEISYDYQCMETEATLYEIESCKCGSLLCRKDQISKFDHYRNLDWQNRMYKWCAEYVTKRIDDLKTKWFSTECYLKREINNRNILRLTTLERVPKGTMIAKFSAQITPDAHYIRHSNEPTCYLLENEVFTLSLLEAQTELTLKYDSI